MSNTQINSQRDSAVDALKLFSCFGVIVIHVHANTIRAEKLAQFFSSFCVPFFFVTSLYYFVNSIDRGATPKSILVKIGKRIGIPLLVWSSIYIALITAKHLITGKDISIDIVNVFLYAGSAEHLYYLSELIIIQIMIMGTFLLVRNTNKAMAMCLIIASSFYLIYGTWLKYYGVLPIRIVISYLIMAFYLSPKTKNPNYIQFAVGVILLIIHSSALFFTYPKLLQEYFFTLPILGFALLMIALNLPCKIMSNKISRVSAATYGIYLSHVFFLELLEYIFEKYSYHIDYNFINKIIIGLFIFFISLVFTEIIRKNNIFRYLLLGESSTL